MNAPQTHSLRHLRVADHVRTCSVGDQVVLLDLKRNRYLGVPQRPWNLVMRAIGGADADGQNDIAGKLAAPLLQQGFLTSAPAQTAAEPDQVALPSPLAYLDARDSAPDMRITFRRLSNFLLATALAWLWMKCYTMHSIARRVRDKRQSHEAHDRNERLLNAVAVFERLRPLAFTSRDRCLYDSLALVNFLAREGLTARWVVGVTAQPFRAHSWVQDGGLVLNDVHENVRRFSPILVV